MTDSDVRPVSDGFFIAEAIPDPVIEFDGATASVWRLDRNARVWRRIAGPGAESYLHNGRVFTWRDGDWHDPHGEWHDSAQ
jgi:hypothetical protein